MNENEALEPYASLKAKILEAVKKLKEEEKSSPTPPKREEGNKENTSTPPARARKDFKKPKVEEVAAHVAEKGYTFDPEAFWNFYESNGWRVGAHVMKSWHAACVTWQKTANRRAKAQAHIDAKMGERKIIASIDPPPIPMDTPMWRKYEFSQRRVSRNFRSDGAKAAISVMNGIIDNRSERRCTIWRMMPREMRERLLREAKEALLALWKTSSCGHGPGKAMPDFTSITVDGCFVCSGR